MRILITGGTGFFGRSILRYLAQRLKSNIDFVKHVYVLTRDVKKFLSAHPEFGHYSWLSIIEGDILDIDRLPNNLKATHLIHCASDSVRTSEFTDIEEVVQIVSGTTNLMNYCNVIGIKKVVYASSGAIYGANPFGLEGVPEIFSNQYNIASAKNNYAISKRYAEFITLFYGKRFHIEVVLARCFAFVGPDLPLNAHFAIGNFINDAIHSKSIIVNGDGDPIRSYLYQDDLAEWLLTLLISGKPDGVYNVGSDMPISIRDLAYLIQEVIAPSKEVIFMNRGATILSNNTNIYLPNIKKIKTELSVDVKKSLREAILLTANHHLLKTSCTKLK
jgi:dTDP-glucose 4,6-dehydratase